MNTNLPKWPQMLVWGQSVTVEQAQEIILCTDDFLTSFSDYAGGNNHKWNTWARKTLGVDANFGTNPGLVWRLQEELREAIGFIQTNYVRNDWASCCYVYGPHGWCHPDGTIGFVDNVGKWPSAEELVSDWTALTEAFPFLALHATFMSGESCEEDLQPHFTLRVKDGKVEMLEPVLPSADEMPKIDRSDAAMLSRMTSRREQGLPDEWIHLYAERLKPHLAKILGSTR